MTDGGWRKPTPIREALAGALRRLGLEDPLRQQGIWQAWAAAVGAGIARHAQPQSLKQGRLLLHVTDSIWLHHLSMMRPRLIEALNARLGSRAVRELVLRIGEVAELPSSPPHPAAPEPPRPLDPQRVAEVEKLLAPLGDAEARDAFRKLLLRAFPSRQ